MRKSNRPLSNSLSIEDCVEECVWQRRPPFFFFFFFLRRRFIVTVYSGFSPPFAIAVVDVQACHVSVVVRALSIEAFRSSFKGTCIYFESGE